MAPGPRGGLCFPSIEVLGRSLPLPPSCLCPDSRVPCGGAGQPRGVLSRVLAARLSRGGLWRTGSCLVFAVAMETLEAGSLKAGAQ